MLYFNKLLLMSRYTWLLLTGSVLLLILLPPPVRAEEALILAVNAFTDSTDAKPGDGICETAPGNGSCPLRAAIMETNARPGPDAIILPAGLYTLTIAGPRENSAATGDLDIFDSLIIQGAGATSSIIDGGRLDRIFDITADQITVHIEGVTLRNGHILHDPGAALLNQGELYLTATTITLNDGVNALHNQGHLIGNMLTISLNQMGPAVDNQGTITLEKSQVVSNYGLGIHNTGSLSLNNSTVAENIAGGIAGGAMEIERSVIRANGLDGISGSGAVQISHSEIISNAGVGVALDSYFERTVIEDSLIQANGGRGIDVSRLLLRRSTVARNQGGGVKVEGYFFSEIEQSTIRANQTTDSGGGIYNNSSLIVVDSTIRDNLAVVNGGGIYSARDLLLTDSTISHNRAVAGQGGGIYQDDAPIDLVNSTISSNSAMGDGGGIAINANYLRQSLYLRLYSSTIVGNGTSGNGGGLYSPLTGVRIGNSIVAHNLTLSAGGFQDCSVQQPLTSLGYNLIGNATGCPLSGISTGNLLGVNPQVGPLQANGGATHTHLPLPGSPVIDAGNPAGCTSFDETSLFFDQRNYLRVVDGNQDGQARCDIGATEFGDGVPKAAYLPAIVASSSSATLRQSPTTGQVAETGSVVGLGLVIGGALLSALVTLFLVDREEAQRLAEEAEAVNAPAGTSS